MSRTPKHVIQFHYEEYEIRTFSVAEPMLLQSITIECSCGFSRIQSQRIAAARTAVDHFQEVRR